MTFVSPMARAPALLDRKPRCWSSARPIATHDDQLHRDRLARRHDEDHLSLRDESAFSAPTGSTFVTIAAPAQRPSAFGDWDTGPGFGPTAR